jgi:hypothetical protein
MIDRRAAVPAAKLIQKHRALVILRTSLAAIHRLVILLRYCPALSFACVMSRCSIDTHTLLEQASQCVADDVTCTLINGGWLYAFPR